MSDGRGDDPPEGQDDDAGFDFVADERDQQEATGVTPPPRPPLAPEVVEVARTSGNRWWAAIAVLVLIIVGGSLLTFYNGRNGSPTIDAGDPLPPFAAPLATEPKLDHDAVNYAASGDEGEAGRVPACSVDNRSVITSCSLLEQGPLVLMMFATGVDECVKAVDDLNRLRSRHPGVQTLAVAIGGEHGKTATTVRNRRWTLPVAYDRDGGLSSRLGAPACPFVLFVGWTAPCGSGCSARSAPTSSTRGCASCRPKRRDRGRPPRPPGRRPHPDGKFCSAVAAPNKKRRSRASRKRKAAGAKPRPPQASAAAPRPVVQAGIPSLKASREEAPKPLWHPWPITELLILVGLVVAVIGLINGSMPTTIGGLVILGSASTELAYREHFAGYRSHSAMLASAVAVIGITAIAFLGSRIGVNLPPLVLAVLAIATFGGLFVVLRRGFRRRTGLSFRV